MLLVLVKMHYRQLLNVLAFSYFISQENFDSWPRSVKVLTQAATYTVKATTFRISSSDELAIITTRVFLAETTI